MSKKIEVLKRVLITVIVLAGVMFVVHNIVNGTDLFQILKDMHS
jgi:endonuclease V-like protein UPF0215 family